MAIEDDLAQINRSVQALAGVAEQLRQQLAVLVQALVAANKSRATAPNAAKPPKPKGKRGRKAKAAANGVDHAPAEPEPAAISYDELSAAVTAVVDGKSVAAAIEILGRFGAKSGRDLKPEQYEAVIAACQDALQTPLLANLV